MLNLFKRKSNEKKEAERMQHTPPESSFFNPLKKGLSKTRLLLTDGLNSLLLRKKMPDQEVFEELETRLIMSDVGVENARKLMDVLKNTLSARKLKDDTTVLTALKEEMINQLHSVERPFCLPTTDNPFVILIVGVNGTGKTTTIGKLANYFKQQGKKVMLAAGDTFRAAAIEQLKIWGERNTIPVIAQQSVADSASVIYDAFASAKARGIEILLADTAGRLHTQSHLMEELKKIIRVIKKIDSSAPHEVWLIMDACVGQNGLSQAKQFLEAVGLTGIILTKLDGTAKGGVIFSVASQLQIPIRFIGLGEQMNDLQPFHANDFVEALFSDSPLT